MPALLVLALGTQLALAKEYHVSVNGSDHQGGSSSEPFKTKSAAALVARPGDVITVHQGIYRERVLKICHCNANGSKDHRRWNGASRVFLVCYDGSSFSRTDLTGVSPML